MPRVALSEEQKRKYKIKDLAGWVCGQMHMSGMNQDEVAQKLGISQGAFSLRINPDRYKTGVAKDPFSYGDLLILFKLFNTSDDEMIRLMKM